MLLARQSPRRHQAFVSNARRAGARLGLRDGPDAHGGDQCFFKVDNPSIRQNRSFGGYIKLLHRGAEDHLNSILV
jgi:hypothetical protein